MDGNKLKQNLEALTCHIHGDTPFVTVVENSAVEIETCCLLFRQQLLLMTEADQ
jgi:hypothetical protein